MGKSLVVFNNKLSVEEYLAWFNEAKEDFEADTKGISPEKRLELIDKIGRLIDELNEVSSQLSWHRRSLIGTDAYIGPNRALEDILGFRRDEIDTLFESTCYLIGYLIKCILNLPRAKIVKKTDEYQQTVRSLKSTKGFIRQLKRTRRKLLWAK